LSSSKPILLNDGQEDSVHSRRVEFKVKTNSEKQILKILQKK
jgi:outer membrane protein OmpA-like peptidoglycan-associated protein